METQTTENLLLQIETLQNRLAEADQLIDAIKAGEVDAFAININNQPAVFTLQSGDYAYRVLVENISEGALNLSKDGLIVYTNIAFYESVKLPYEKVIGQNIFQFIHPDSKEIFKKLLKKGLAGKSTGEINLIVGKKSCSVYVSLTSLYPALPTVGVILSNLTEKKEALRVSGVKKSLQNILQSAPAATAVLEGPEHKYILANQAYQKLFNRQAKDFLGKSIQEVFPELKGTEALGLVDRVFETGESFIAPEYALSIDVHNDGVLRQNFYNFSVEPLKNDSAEIYAVIATIYDITEQVESRKKIEENEKQQAFLLKMSDALRRLHDPVEIEETATKIALDFMGADRCYYSTLEEGNAIVLRDAFRAGLTSLAGVYPISNFPLFKAVVDAGGPFIVDDVYTSDIIEEGLRQICVQVQVISMINVPVIKGGKPVGVLSLVQSKPRKWTETELQLTIETAERTWVAIERAKAAEKIKKSEQEIREIKEQLELSIQAGKIGIWHWDVKKDILSWSKEQNEIYGVSDSEAITNSAQFNALIVPEDLKRIQDDQSSGNKLDHEYDFRIIRKNDGEIRWVKSRAKNIVDPQGALQYISGVNIDVTEQVTALIKIQESEEALAQQKQLLESVTENTDMSLFLMNGNQHCIYMNQAAEKMTGFTLEDLKGKQLHYYVHHSHPDGSPFPLEECPIDQALPSQKRMKGEEVFVHKDGFFYPVAFTASPIILKGNTIGTVLEVRDTTEDKRIEQVLKESESRFRGMADSSPVLIWTLDALGLSSYYNKTFLDFIGASKEDDISDWKKIVHPDDFQSTFDTIHKAMAKKSAYSLENRLLRADGQWRWVMAQGNPRMDANNEFLGFVGSSIDITERKQHENELMEAKAAAENAAKSKQQFLSNMSHEIRTPLNSILGFTNVLFKSELGLKQKEFVQAIKTSGNSLNVLINDILDLAKVNAGKMTFEKQPFEIRKSIESLLYSFNLKIQEKNLELITEYDSKMPSMLLGDSVRLNQIILNLIGNAIKFTPKGKIKLSVKLLQQDEEGLNIEFTVADSGIGIAANKIDSIFNLFEQAEHGTSNVYGGTGLGLAIVKQLIEAQGGSINVKSKFGEGSIFTFVLPFEKIQIELEPEIELPILDLEIKNLRVLVAEDVALNQLLIKMILSDFGFEYEIVGDGKLAVEKIKAHTYDIILMDLQMPEMNGFEATEYIRNTLKSQIPIIALTADVTTADVTKCKELGMDDYISKPISENLLYSKMVELVKRKR